MHNSNANGAVICTFGILLLIVLTDCKTIDPAVNTSAAPRVESFRENQHPALPGQISSGTRDWFFSFCSQPKVTNW
jgi:hypothetical protein